eukprot:Lithocolla_globosa_v1_NODE_1095_length_2875_cov_9.641135.p6 type:complete len:116 gc:universal NODE_1095_length_2875_cov_9.641135:2802-2455(-)
MCRCPVTKCREFVSVYQDRMGRSRIHQFPCHHHRRRWHRPLGLGWRRWHRLLGLGWQRWCGLPRLRWHKFLKPNTGEVESHLMEGTTRVQERGGGLCKGYGVQFYARTVVSGGDG